MPGAQTIRERLSDDESGFTVIELMASLSVLAIGFFALAGALGIGFKQITLGRQRQTATEIANARIEHLRNVPYDAVALSSVPEYSDDVDDPDHYVSGGGSQYDYSGDGDLEDLLIDESSGQVLHLEDPKTVGTTTMAIYQYVTWADQPNNVKRLTVVVVYRPAAIEGAAKMVRVSTFFTPGKVTVVGTSAGPSGGSGSTPTPTPSVSPTGSCTSDTSAPSGSFQIVSSTGQTGYTGSTTVTLSMSFSDGCGPIRARFSNDGTTYGSDVTYDSSNPTVTWTLTSGDGTKSVHGKVRDGNGNEQSLTTQSVILDTTKPTYPGTLVKSASCSGSTRTVTLTWGASSDAHFSGYRVYESDNSGDWTIRTTTSLLTYTTSHQKNLDSVRFYVTGYDAAGNESDETNIVSLAKNKCS